MMSENLNAYDIGYVTTSGGVVISNTTVEIPADACAVMDALVIEKLADANSEFDYAFIKRKNGKFIATSDPSNPKYQS